MYIYIHLFIKEIYSYRTAIFVASVKTKVPFPIRIRFLPLRHSLRHGFSALHGGAIQRRN